MIEALKEIGEFILLQGRKELLEIEVEDPNKNGRYQKVLKIIFEWKNNLQYKEIAIEDYKKDNILKYLYARKGSRGPNYSPTCLLSGKKASEVFENRIVTWCTNYLKKGIPAMLDEKEQYFLQMLITAVLENRERIEKDVEEKVQGIKEGKILTFTFWKENKELYLGDIEIFKKLLLYEKYEKYRRYSNRGVCALCGKFTEVFGETGILKFYNVDKFGFVAGGAIPYLAFKDFPLCHQCLLKLQEGKKFRDTKLDFSFYGHRYYLLPKLSVYDEGLFKKTLDLLSERKPLQTLKDGRLIKSDEERLLAKAEQLNDQIGLIFEFYEKPQKNVERILLLMENVLPSRITKIFEIKQQLEHMPIFLNEDIQFDFLNGFFKLPGDKQAKAKDFFFVLVESAFKSKPLSRECLFNLAMQVLRPLFTEEREHRAVLRVFITVLFYEKLGLLKKKGGTMQKGPYVEFFDQYKEFFDTPLRRAIFLLGVLTEKLLNYQWSNRGSKPFRKQLKGLRLSASDLRGLLPKIQGKFMEYDAYDYPEIRKAIAYYFLQSGNKWNIGEDEMNFIFVLGMNMAGDPAFK